MEIRPLNYICILNLIINTFKLKQGKMPPFHPIFHALLSHIWVNIDIHPLNHIMCILTLLIDTVQMRYHTTIFDQVENFMILQILPPFYPHRGVKIANLPNKVCTYSYSDINVA